MALSDRDCRHGRQIGKCADCALDHMEMAADADIAQPLFPVSWAALEGE